MTLTENRIIADVISKVKLRLYWRLYWSWGPLNPMSLKRGTLDTDMHARRTLCERKSRAEDNVSTSQGTPKIATKPGETEGSFTASEGTNPAHTLILDFQPSER